MPLSADLSAKVEGLFTKMDLDGDGKLTKTEAKSHFKKFSKIAANSMFKEVDTNGDAEVTLVEFKEFFENVMQQKEKDSEGNDTEKPMYTEEDVIETIDELSSGEAWVDCAHRTCCRTHSLALAPRLAPHAHPACFASRVAQFSTGDPRRGPSPPL